MQIKNVRFSYAMLRGPTEEDDRLVEKGFSVTVRLTPAEALALRVPAIVGYNPQKLLPSPEKARPLTMRERYDVFARDFINEMVENRFSSLSRMPLLFPGEEISLMRERTPTFRHHVAIVHADIVPARLHRLLDRPDIRVAIIDIDEPFGEIPGRSDSFDALLAKVRKQSREEVVATAAGMRDKSYLKHDRTKSHKRRRR